jgi:formate dehydrogenase subunit gamma
LTDASHSGAPKILRFRKTERLVHWAIAIPFLTCFTTAAMMVALQGRVDHPVFRASLSWIHRISGLCLIALPFAAVFRSKGDLRIHIYNVRQAWIWTLSDVRWLAVAGAAAVNKKVALPEQGKFNAAEKLNFMVLMGTYPFYIITGLTIWLTHNAFLSWVVHVSIAIMGAPLVLGHIYMAAINPSSRVGLQGMITGLVDRHWARHHYRRWYEEHFEPAEGGAESTPGTHGAGQSVWRREGTHILCAACGEGFGLSIEVSAGDVPAGHPLTCPHCGAPIGRLDSAPAPDNVAAALAGMSAGGGASDMLSEALLLCEDSPDPPPASTSYIGFATKSENASPVQIPAEKDGPEAADASA